MTQPTDEAAVAECKRLKALADDHFRNAQDLAQRLATERQRAERAEKALGEVWQPIATAPTELLNRIIGTDGYWVEFLSFVPREEGDDREGPGWVAYHGDVTPTHWMPVPAANPRMLWEGRSGREEG